MQPERDFDPVLREVMRTSSGTASSACPDAETMAAWQARALPAAELAACERHAADCARCRAMLAAFVRADLEALVPTAREEAADAMPFWRRWRLNWVVPIAATATVLALYVATPSPTNDRILSEESVAQGASDAARSNEVVVPLEKERDASADGLASSRASSGSGDRQPQSPAAARMAAPAAPAERTVETRADANDRREQIDADAASDQRATGAATPAPAAPPARSTSSSSSSFAPVPGAPGAPTPAAPEPVPPPPSQAGAAEARPLSAPQGGVGKLADAPSAERASSALRRERSADLNEQATGARGGSGARAVPLSGAPTGLRFRIDGERLERSASGDTWSGVPLPAGVLATGITSGTSAGRTIWLVGRGGLVLRAPEGDRFTRVSGPAAVDLLSVTAEDARTATVVASDGRQYSTTDGGARWTVR